VPPRHVPEQQRASPCRVVCPWPIGFAHGSFAADFRHVQRGILGSTASLIKRSFGKRRIRDLPQLPLAGNPSVSSPQILSTFSRLVKRARKAQAAEVRTAERAEAALALVDAVRRTFPGVGAVVGLPAVQGSKLLDARRANTLQ